MHAGPLIHAERDLVYTGGSYLREYDKIILTLINLYIIGSEYDQFMVGYGTYGFDQFRIGYGFDQFIIGCACDQFRTGCGHDWLWIYCLV